VTAAWEYRVETNLGVDLEKMSENPEAALDDLGSEGWELITMLQVVRQSSTMAYFFKRQID
jgi:Domain of unknown function (DUF4177)